MSNDIEQRTQQLITVPIIICVSCGNHAGHIRNIYISLYIYIDIYSLIEGSLEVKLPTIWTDEKQRWEESEKRGEEERRSKKRKSQKKEDPGARKGRKVAKHRVFPNDLWLRRGEVGLLKPAGAEPAGQMRDENCTPLDVVTARSTFRSQNVQKHLSVGPTFGS